MNGNLISCRATDEKAEDVVQSTAVLPTPLPHPTSTISQPPPAPTAPPVDTPTVPSAAPPASSATPNTRFAFHSDAALEESAAALGVPLIRLDSERAGRWQFAPNTVPHPIGVVLANDVLLLLDSGRLISAPLDDPSAATLLLQPGDRVEDLPVVEPLAVATSGEKWLVLDRVGDVYCYDGAWRLAWFGRSLDDSGGHYYVALAADVANALLVESSYRYAQRLGTEPRIWPLPAQLGVDAALDGAQTYVLFQSLFDSGGTLLRYENAAVDGNFAPGAALVRVRGVAVSDSSVYVLDWGGRRVVQLDQFGQVVQLWQTPPATVSFWVGRDGALVFAAADAVYFVGQPERSASVTSTLPPVEPSPFWGLDGATLGWGLPIEGTRLTERPLQMPGAPRHYRLGVHEGLDFYWRRGTTVRAVADGVVIRADVAYERPRWQAFAAQKVEVDALGTTPAEALDFYRGRQVWVEHADGMVTRYAHLGDIADGINVGSAVTKGQPLGAVGNTGSPVSVTSESEDAHLHVEIWRDAHYLGQFVRPVEAWEFILTLWK